MITEALREYARTRRPAKFKHDRTQTIGASEIGLCARRVWYVKHGIDQDEDFHQEPATRGTVMEKKFWQPAMKRRFGKHLLFSGAQQKTFFDGPLSATPDGILIDMPKDSLKDVGVPNIGNDATILIENKTIDPRVNIHTSKLEHEMQVQVGIGTVKATANSKNHVFSKLEYAVISYIDASFWHEVKEYVVRFNPRTYENAKTRAGVILHADKADELLPEGWIAGGKECGYCPWAKQCLKQRVDIPEENAPATSQFTAEITEMCVGLRAVKDSIKKLENDEREHTYKIKERLKEKGVRSIPNVVVWSPVKGRESYDNEKIHAAAIAAGIDIEQFSTVGEPTDRLTLKL